MSVSRRGLLGGVLAALAAPAIIRTPGLLMPVKPWKTVTYDLGLISAGVSALAYLTPDGWRIENAPAGGGYLRLQAWSWGDSLRMPSFPPADLMLKGVLHA